jgi:WD repeat-containing protein 23
MTSTSPDGNPVQIPIFFGETRRTRIGLFEYHDVDGIWSCRFSADGKEVIAGGSGRILSLFFEALLSRSLF